MFSFPIAGGTNYHKICGLKPHEFSILQFWRPEICSGSGRAAFLLKTVGENPFPCLQNFQRLPACLGSWPLMSDSATPWTAAHQAPASMGFSRQEYCLLHSGGLPGNYSISPARAWQEGGRCNWVVDCRANGSGKGAMGIR